MSRAAMRRNEQLKMGMNHENLVCTLIDAPPTHSRLGSWVQEPAKQPSKCFFLMIAHKHSPINLHNSLIFSLFVLCPSFTDLWEVKQTIHWVRAFTYGATSSSLNSRNGKSTPTTATEQFSFVNFCITLPFFSPYRIALHAALQRIQHDVNQLIDRHCSSLASLHSYSHRSPSPRSFPRSKTVERGPFSRSGCESRSHTHCILSTRRREMYGRDEDLWTTEKSTKEGKRNVHTADQQTNTIRTTFVCESAEMLF